MTDDLKDEIGKAKKADKELADLEMQATNGKVFNESDSTVIKELVEGLKATGDKIKKLMKKVKDVME